MNKAKILYYSDHLRAKDTVQAVHSRDFLRAMRKYSSFRVVSYPPIDFNKDDKPSQSSSHPGQPKIPRIFNFPYQKYVLYREWNNLKRYLTTTQPDIIIARHNALFLKVLRKIAELKIPLLLEVNSLISYDCKLLNTKLKPAVEKLENYILRKAASILIVSGGFKKLMREKGINTNKVFILPNAAAQDLFFPKEGKRKPREKDKIILTYIGNIYRGRDIDILIEGFNLARKDIGNLKLIIVGKGDFQSPDPENIEYLGFIEHERIPDILSKADIALAIYKREFIKDGSPLKVFEYMSMAKPSIVTGGGQLDTILRDNKAGLIYEPESAQSLASAIITLAKDKNLRREMGRNARKAILENYTYKKNVEKVDKVCQEILSR